MSCQVFTATKDHATFSIASALEGLCGSISVAFANTSCNNVCSHGRVCRRSSRVRTRNGDRHKRGGKGKSISLVEAVSLRECLISGVSKGTNAITEFDAPWHVDVAVQPLKSPCLAMLCLAKH